MAHTIATQIATWLAGRRKVSGGFGGLGGSGRLYLEKLGPNDDPEYVARRLLRQKCGHNSFYAPIKYPASYH
jgi:hypothetical protein